MHTLDCIGPRLQSQGVPTSGQLAGAAGYRSYGATVPGYAQGAYYPGDEPVWAVEDAELVETPFVCPQCLHIKEYCDDFRATRFVAPQLHRVKRGSATFRRGTYYCDHCEEIYEDLAAVLLQTAQDLKEALHNSAYTEHRNEELHAENVSKGDTACPACSLPLGSQTG